MSRPQISFEFFPPKTLDASFRLWETARALAPLAPDFVSVTYGAGGTTRKLTHEAVTTIHRHYGIPVAAHLTCVEATTAETMEIVQSYADAGIREIVALRGDAPKGQDRFVPHPDGFADSVELITAIAARGDMTIRVGAYPEPHPDSSGADGDVFWLKRKIDAGATSAITQFFFDADTFFRFRDKCAAAGIDAPIIPGILPIQGWAGAKRFAATCGTSVPAAKEMVPRRKVRRCARMLSVPRRTTAVSRWNGPSALVSSNFFLPRSARNITGTVVTSSSSITRGLVSST